MSIALNARIKELERQVAELRVQVENLLKAGAPVPAAPAPRRNPAAKKP